MAEAPRRGTLHLVVGPSGAGKDTLIDAARAARPDILFPVRAITRPADAGGEHHEAVSEDDFATRAAEGGFALWWRAHGLGYGIPISAAVALERGRHVVANVSRAVVEDARSRFSPLKVLLVTAAPEILATRLSGRGRETAEDIARRLARAPYAPPSGPEVCEIRNDGAMEAGVAALLDALDPPRG
jgi:ribose 1,5-bisphosphokinase